MRNIFLFTPSLLVLAFERKNKPKIARENKTWRELKMRTKNLVSKHTWRNIENIKFLKMAQNQKFNQKLKK